MADEPILEFFSHASYNREVFLLNEGHAFRTYSQIHRNFDTLATVPSRDRDAQGKSLVSLIPLVLLMQRQGLFAFSALSRYQSFEAWVLLRPCIEAALIMGKWIDNPKNAEVWNNRLKNRKAYQKAYQAWRLVSKSLPRAKEIQAVLSRVNDDFMHLNERYYSRSLEVSDASGDLVNVEVHYFDRDGADHQAHVLAFLHLVLVVQDSVADLLASRFPDSQRVNVGLEVSEASFAARVREFLEAHPKRAPVLRELGLWQLDSVNHTAA